MGVIMLLWKNTFRNNLFKGYALIKHPVGGLCPIKHPAGVLFAHYENIFASVKK